MRPAIIVDFDGTLSSTKHREHFVLQEPKQWQPFFEAAKDDPLHEWCKETILAMKAKGYAIILLTGRPEWMRELSIKWLEQYEIPYDHFYMRADDDHRDDPIVKWDIYQKEIKPEYSVLFALEDRQRVVNMWREHHITCLQCDVGDF